MSSSQNGGRSRNDEDIEIAYPCRKEPRLCSQRRSGARSVRESLHGEILRTVIRRQRNSFHASERS